MSTLNVNAINVNAIDKESGSTLTLGGAGTTVNVSNMVPDVALSNRNLIINGAMNVAQRGTQVTGVTSAGYYTCDRMLVQVNGLGTWTVDQSTDAPNGFSNSLKATCTTADASPAAGDYSIFVHRIEAQNLQNLAFGTADAKSMTLSFWVKSNKTGAATFDFLQKDNSNKMISKSYTINSADTWEYKTISIPADTAGVINNDNGQGFQISWWLNSGTDFSSGSLQSNWSTYDNANRNASNLGVGGAINDYLAITGVQLEVGDVATPFEHEPYAETLQKCRWYYRKSRLNRFTAVVYTPNGDTRSSPLHIGAMRAAPTISPANYTNHSINFGPTGSATNSPTVQWNFSVGGSELGYTMNISQNGFYSGYPNSVVVAGAHGPGTIAFDAEL